MLFILKFGAAARTWYLGKARFNILNFHDIININKQLSTYVHDITIDRKASPIIENVFFTVIVNKSLKLW